MNILIIGSGYLGRAAGKYLRAKGHQITGTTRSKDKLQEITDTLGSSFLLTQTNLAQAFAGKHIVLFSAGADNPLSYKETYYDNAKAIVEAFLREPSLTQVIYTGSTSVYGEHQGAEVTEDASLNPTSPQGQILLETEALFKQLPQSCIFRLGELIGPGRTIEERIRASNGGYFSGSGESITNFSPLPDVIRAIDFAIEKHLFGIYNLCSTMHAPRKELYKELTRAKKLKPIKWDKSLTSHQSGNKTVISEKIIKAGFTFEALPWEGVLTPTEH